MLRRLWEGARMALRTPARSARQNVGFEPLETRQMLSTTGNDYGLSGFSWSNPSKITYSIPTDGVSWDQGINNLNASLNAAYGGTTWKRDFAKSLQTWAAPANINVVPVTDNNAPFNSRGLSQSDPNFGDIRLGGFNFQSNQVLAQTYFPPPNGVTAAGDVEMNTGFSWGRNAQFDLFSVMLHETGHSFGLLDLQNSPSVENTQYGGVRSGLMPGDIAGIQAIYGARTADAYQSAGRGISASTAIDLTSQLAGSGYASVSNVSLATIGDVEYYRFTAPAGSNPSLKAAAVASGISSLSPKITVYDASMNPLGSAADPNAWSNSPQVSLGNLQAGKTYIIAVTGATSDVFAVGAYSLQVAISGATITKTPTPITNPTPTPVPTNPTPTPTPIPNPTPTRVPQNPGGPGHSQAQPIGLGLVNQLVLPGQTIYSASDFNLFDFRAGRAGTTIVAATGSTRIQIVNPRGQIVASGVGAISFRVPKAGSFYYVITTTANGAPVTGYSLAIVSQSPQQVRNARAIRSHQEVPATPPTVTPVVATIERVAWKTPNRVPVVNDRLRTHATR
jgi:hypothetical protein